MTTPRCALVFLLAQALLALGAAAWSTELCVPIMPEPPVTDGILSPGEWEGAARLDGLSWQGTLERRRARVYVGATDTHLHFAIVSQLPEEGELLTEVLRDSENLVFDDSLEVWVDPTFGAERGRRFQMLANFAGHRWYKMHTYGGLPDDPSWRGKWTIANGTQGGNWVCEVTVPVEDVAPGRDVCAGSWGINLCRNWKQDWAWSALDDGAYKPTAKVTFVREPAPVVSWEQRGDLFAGDVDSVLVLRNPGLAPLSVQAAQILERDVMPALKESQTVDLAPGEMRELAVRTKDVATRKFKLSARVQSPDGKVVYLDRAFGWAAAEPWRWITRPRVVPPLDFQFAYYPYLNRMRILADTSNLPHGAVLEELTATVREVGGAVVRTVRFDNLKDGKQELSFELPPLEGQYEIALRATGQGVPTEEVVKPFERTRFEWEHNTLGRSTRVYPPFTPIRVEGNRVFTVLREHEMNGGGLWDQVVATGKPILAAPMRWELMGADGPAPVTLAPLHFVHQAEHEAVATGGFSSGPLRASTRCTWDYDGTMRVDLTLRPGDGTAVSGLDLVIPLRADQATHYHAMGDGIRNTLYDRVPQGEGVVWSAEKVQCNDLPRNFCTYIFVGTPVRGLCWFAENDRGWGWDSERPNVELVRREGVVEMRVHLINRPETVQVERTLTFGLLAAPVKPRITPDWRHKWRRDNYSLLGTDINWLALGDCGSVYPAGCDLFLWEMIRRGNQEQLSDEEIEATIERGRPYFEPYGPEPVATFVNHVRYNLRARYGTKMVFYYNRASYQLAPEFETFKDEWCLTDWRSIGKGNGIWEIKIVPSESYIDHALYWYDKSFDIGGNQGVYWDNWFFVGSYNTMMTGAYRRSDGTIVPSTGIWGLRELSKRTFQLMNERGMLPITMPHMTSTQILPLHSFATVQYDWEWKYSEGDVQYRFPREYILMVSNGELAGTWPVLLGDHGPQAEDSWVGRTFAAVAMVHELDCSYPGWSKVGQEQLALFRPVDEILARPGVEAYRYWDERPQPVVADDPDLPTIAYVLKGQEAVFAVVSYAEEDRQANLTLDLAAMGMEEGCIVTDTETGEELQLEGHRLSFPLKKHDVRVCRVVPR